MTDFENNPPQPETETPQAVPSLTLGDADIKADEVEAKTEEITAQAAAETEEPGQPETPPQPYTESDAASANNYGQDPFPYASAPHFGNEQQYGVGAQRQTPEQGTAPNYNAQAPGYNGSTYSSREYNNGGYASGQQAPYQQNYQQNYQQGYNQQAAYYPQRYDVPPAGYLQKSRLAAGLLGILFGTFGIHNFYLGYTTRAVVQLIISLVGGLITCGIATVVISIWGFVEGILILSASSGPRVYDGRGVILRE